MKLQQKIRQRIEAVSLAELAKRLGYNEAGARFVARVERACSDPDLGLLTSGFDFKYSSEAFLLRLCAALDIDMADYQQEIDAIQAQDRRMRSRFHSCLFIDTDFDIRKNTAPLFALAFMESRRRLYLEPEIQMSPVKAQIEHVRKLIPAHFKASGGSIEFWGEIKRYRLVYGEKQSLVFSVDGALLGDGRVTSSAQLTLKGKSILPVLTHGGRTTS